MGYVYKLFSCDTGKLGQLIKSVMQHGNYGTVEDCFGKFGVATNQMELYSFSS